MIRWLRALFGLCEHNWKILETHDIGTPSSGPDNGPRIYGKHYTLQCEKCGDLKSKRFEV